MREMSGGRSDGRYLDTRKIALRRESLEGGDLDTRKFGEASFEGFDEDLLGYLYSRKIGRSAFASVLS